MLGYDYEIIYKKGRENVMVDALPHQYEESRSLLTLFMHISEWLEVVHKDCFNDPTTVQLIRTLQEFPHITNGYSWKDDTLWYKENLVLVYP